MSDQGGGKKTVFIHIGMNKTGTSAIQRVLNENRGLLRSHDLLYPRTGCAGDAHYELSRVLGFHHGRSQDRVAEGDVARMRENFAAELAESGGEKVVFSSENFLLPKPIDEVRQFFSGFDCRIVVYLRRHDYWWAAAYNQAVKMVANPPWDRGFEAFLRFHRRRNPLYGNYRKLVNRWAAVFGKDSLIVRPYEAQQNAPNIVGDFLAAIGRRDLIEVVATDVPRVNESLGPRETFLIDVMQRSSIAANIRAQVIDYIVKGANRGAGVDSIAPELRMRLIAENADDYRYIARTLLGREDGRLFLEADPDPDVPWEPVPQPRIMDVVETVVAAMTVDTPPPD